MAKLIHVSADDSGYHRKGRGKGFEYFDDNYRKITDKSELKRIDILRIPPAWKNVWVCANPDGHLQATGIDAKGRKQYLYHAEWTRRSHIAKFDRMAGFAKVLPDIRKRISLDLNKKGWPREKVLSLLISILDQCSLRIGNKAYEQENGSYGLTTLKLKHLKKEGGAISFQFKAKSGIYQKTQIQGRKLKRLITECSELPGQEVFQYLDEEGLPHPVFSHDVNAYLQEISGGDYTAKDFRTWGGTVGAVDLFPAAVTELENSSKRNLATCLVTKVAEKLGNTVTVCRAYYIHPAVLALTEKQPADYEKLTHTASAKYKSLSDQLSQSEMITLYLIESA